MQLHENAALPVEMVKKTNDIYMIALLRVAGSHAYLNPVFLIEKHFCKFL